MANGPKPQPGKPRPGDRGSGPQGRPAGKGRRPPPGKRGGPPAGKRGGPPRKGPPPPKAPVNPLDVATPGAGGPADDESLMFMTHAPGAIVPKREEHKVSESFAGRLLGGFGIGKKKAKAAAPAGPPGRGLDAATPAGPAKPEKAAWEDKTWAGQQIKHDTGPQVVTAAATVGPAPPSFFKVAFGALATPLRGFPVTAVHVLIVGLALLMLEVSSFLGLIACLVAAAEIVSLLMRVLRDACAGREKVAWPDVGSLLSALVPFAAALLLLVPGLVLTVVALGPPALEGESSLAARGKRMLTPIPQGQSAPEGAALGHSTLLTLEAAIGVVGAQGAPPPSRSTQEVAEALAASAKARLDAALDVGSASGIGLGARVLLLLGLLACPMALLSSARLQSALTALHLPLLVRSCLRAFGAYLFVSAVFAVQLAAILGVLLALPAHLGGAAGHVVWVGALSVLLVCSPMILADLLGRLYTTHQATLGWD